MKTITFTRAWVVSALVALWTGWSFIGPNITNAYADGTVSFDTFYRELAPYGHWMNNPQYGWVWTPSGMPYDWQPYTEGHWVYTDDAGWEWVSDYVWGDIPFHYGRWVLDQNVDEWLWVPDTEWAPAWVAFRTGDDWIGWAPLPPGFGWRDRGVVTHIGGGDFSDLFFVPFTFVRVRDFDRDDLRGFIALRDRDDDLFGRTRDVTRFDFDRGRFVNRGLSPELIERATGRRVAHFRSDDVARANQLRFASHASPMLHQGFAGPARLGAPALGGTVQPKLGGAAVSHLNHATPGPSPSALSHSFPVLHGLGQGGVNGVHSNGMALNGIHSNGIAPAFHGGSSGGTIAHHSSPMISGGQGFSHFAPRPRAFTMPHSSTGFGGGASFHGPMPSFSHAPSFHTSAPSFSRAPSFHSYAPTFHGGGGGSWASRGGGGRGGGGFRSGGGGGRHR